MCYYLGFLSNSIVWTLSISIVVTRVVSLNRHVEVKANNEFLAANIRIFFSSPQKLQKVQILLLISLSHKSAF